MFVFVLYVKNGEIFYDFLIVGYDVEGVEI